MASIYISDLCPAGSELFDDSENYLNDLTDDELNMTQGGFAFTVVLIKAGYLAARSSNACVNASVGIVTFTSRWGRK